jgi:hypothetical protein
MDIVAQEGLLGSFFTITIIKVIPDTGVFEHFGTDFELFPCNDYPAEFEAGLGSIARSY